jgi:hypothetical protein
VSLWSGILKTGVGGFSQPFPINIFFGDQMEKPVVFIYAKNKKIKCLDFETASKKHLNLIEKGWVHTATFNAALWIQHLYDSKDKIGKINELSNIILTVWLEGIYNLDYIKKFAVEKKLKVKKTTMNLEGKIVRFIVLSDADKKIRYKFWDVEGKKDLYQCISN